MSPLAPSAGPLRCVAGVALVFAASGLASCGQRRAGAERPARRDITILHTADLHSHLFDEPLAIGAADAARGLGPEGETVSVGGVARLATVLERERAASDRSVYLDAGDVLEGTAVYTLFHGVPELQALDALGVDAMAIGNHDLDPGDSVFRALEQRWAKFPLLAANLAPELSDGVAAETALVERDGVTVGVIGLGHAPDRAPDVGASAAAVMAAIDRIRSAADVIAVVSHLGSDLDAELVPRTTGIDVVLGGHTHDVLEPKTVFDCDRVTAERYGCNPRPVPVVHPGAYGRYVGRVDLVVSSTVEDLRGADPRAPGVVLDAHCSLLPVDAGVPERADVRALLAPYHDALVRAGFEKPFAFAPETVSRTADGGGDSALGDAILDALRSSAGADLAFLNTTGIRADVPKGTVTLDDLYRVLPFDDEVVTFEASGKDVSRALEDVARSTCERRNTSQAELSGGTLELDCSGSGSAVLAVAGAPLAVAATYRVVTTSFLTESGGFFDLPDVTIHRTGALLRDVWIDRVRKASPCPEQPPLPCIDTVADGRIRVQ